MFLALLVVATLLGLCCLSCKEPDVGFKANGKIEAKSEFQENTSAPAVTLPTLQGKNISLSDYQGKVILLNFWAQWCAPCVKEMPSFERLYQKLKDQGLVVVAVNVDALEAARDVQTFVDEHHLSFPILLDPDFTSVRRFAVNGFPETFFIGRDGKFRRFADPESGEEQVRIMSDRPWDAPLYVQAVSRLLEASNK